MTLLRTSRGARIGPGRISIVHALLLALILGAVLTHYLEVYEVRWAAKVRRLIYPRPAWQGFDDVLGSTGQPAKRTIPLSITGHPVRAALSVRRDVYHVLSTHLVPPPIPVLSSEVLKTSDDKGVNRDGSQAILRAADWLLSTGQSLTAGNIKALMIPYYFPERTYRIDPPWYSGMAQGMAGEVLLAAYFISGDVRYYQGAIQAANGLRIPVRLGGTAVSLNEGLWFEEYASPRLGDSFPLVLNGHMFAMDLLFWLKQIDPARWTPLYNAAHRAVEERVVRYLSLGWSYYDARGNFASGVYHRLHARQLRRLAQVGLPASNIQEAVRTIERDILLPIGVFERLIRQHNRMLIFLWLIHSSFFFALLWSIRCILSASGSAKACTKTGCLIRDSLSCE
ncbi:MAG: hypothetical protein A4E63_02102 [Syntrophorhabdus sp. PtaU1.Bin050]|nr:MAG: hypothetical protein A4E63_02102 [Syntrophorhabdus sp. PtaU1.Bin050]